MYHFLLPLLGLLVGVILGLIFPFTFPVAYARYMAVAILASLDSVLGGLRANMEGQFNPVIFISGFFCNALFAAALTYVGDRLGLEIYYAAVFAFGVRIFQNLAVMRRHLLENWNSEKKRGA
ncbi:MAG: small basic family protein [Firmicutes bacterium]|jgi:small basic protein|nr:small basic family protein [Bacillota bacterium]